MIDGNHCADGYCLDGRDESEISWSHGDALSSSLSLQSCQFLPRCHCRRERWRSQASVTGLDAYRGKWSGGGVMMSGGGVMMNDDDVKMSGGGGMTDGDEF